MIKKIIITITMLLVTGSMIISPLHAQDEIISLNKGTLSELKVLFEELDLPETLAQALVDFRKANGPFKTSEQLTKVPGMTQDFLEEINPVEMNGDVVYDPDAPPALAPSKC